MPYPFGVRDNIAQSLNLTSGAIRKLRLLLHFPEVNMIELAFAVDELRATDGPASMEGTWTVAEVLSRHEKRTAENFRRVGIGVYLPVYERVRRYERSNVQQTLPLFPGYLFVCCEPECLYDVRRCDSVYGLIQVKNQAKFVRELDNIHLATREGDVTPYPYPVVGQRCEIREGHPMRGTQGIVIFAGKHRKFILQVEMLGQSISVEDIDPEFLEVID